MNLKEIKTNECNCININEQDIIESNNRHLMENIIKKWLNLQKIIKEEMTLEEIILNHQEKEFNQLKDYFKQFYELKLKNRSILELIRNSNIKRNLMIKDKDNITIDIFKEIEEFLFLFRNDYNYITTLIGLISDEDNNEKILSLAELFSIQFYENILIPNPEKEEFLLLIFNLLEKDIKEMCATSTEGFLEEDSFLGKFISFFNKRHELIGFLLSIINPMISDIENATPGNYLNLSLYDINDYYQNNSSLNSDLNNSEKNIEIKDILLSHIPKIKVNFYKNKKENEENTEIKNNNDNEESEDSSEELDEKEINLDEDNNLTNEDYKQNDTNNIISNKDEYNDSYIFDLNLDYFEEKIKQEENPFLKKIYLYQIEQIIYDENIFSNNNLIESLKSNQNKIDLITKKYKSNFLYIKSKIDWLLKSLFDKIDAIPYSIRCISKLIFIIIKNKYPSLNKYLQNSFVGKYFLNEYLFPVLNIENITIFNSQILSTDTKNCLNIIIDVLDHANKCTLFKSNTDFEYTIFNHYIIELIPILNNFYDKLYDIDLPPCLNNIINNHLNPDLKESNSNDYLIYDYFKENNDELINLQCICFSLDDILFIISLINRDIEAFNSLRDFQKFEKCYNIIKKHENKIKKIISNNNDTTIFFISFKEEKNPKFENSPEFKNIKNKKILFNISNITSVHSDYDIISKNFKYCLKEILRGLNLLNNKDYSYLNMSFTSKQFFICLKYTLDDFGELIKEKKEMSLKWLGEFIFNNKDLLENKYIKNDYELLYNELYKEELNNLNELKIINSSLIARDGMNLHCAENYIKKATYENFIINKNKDYIGIDKFIEEENIEVCFQFKENELNSNDSFINDKSKMRTKKINQKALISIIDEEKCPHNIKIIEAKKEKKEKIISLPIKLHSYSIKDFISKFSDKPWNIPEKITIPKKYVEEDITNGKRDNGIFSTFSQYKSILKKHLKNPKNSKINLMITKSDTIYTEIVNKIEDYMMRQIYIYVYPNEKLQSDIDFYNQTKKLSWLCPEHLEIKKVYINQLTTAILWIKKMDEKKSIQDKLFCISNAYSTMNNTIKFSSGKNVDAGQDELTPIFQYIMIKAQPQRIFSNINYIKCFLEEAELTGILGFLLSQMESAACFIMEINYQSLKITEEEYNRKMKENESN